MLVLTRKSNERVMIGDDVVITILEVRGDSSVRIGIEAPRDRRIQREEIIVDVALANRHAARAPHAAELDLKRLLSGA